MKHIILSFNENTSQETNTVNIKDINNLPNMFFDQVVIKENINISNIAIDAFLDNVISKVKPNGILEYGIVDLKVLSKYYLNGLIQDDHYLSITKQFLQPASINTMLIYAKDRKNISITNISYNEYIIGFKINRISI
jgi:hypothetical protein